MNVTKRQKIEKPFSSRSDQFDRIWEMAPDGTAGEPVLEQSQVYRDCLRSLAARLESLREDDRARIARDLHDELGQMLTAIKLDLSCIEHQLDDFDGDPRVNPILERVMAATELADTTIQTVQEIAADMRPCLLDQRGLAKGFQHEISRFEKRAGVSCSLRAPQGEPPLPSTCIMALFRILREALTNVARHAAATQVEVDLQFEPDGCRLIIRDNGRGFIQVEVASPKALGLLGMRERARSLGGNVTFSSSPGEGTAVTVWIPHPSARPESA